jgi:hypothetical protein
VIDIKTSLYQEKIARQEFIRSSIDINEQSITKNEKEHSPFKRAIEVWNKSIEKGCLPIASVKKSIFGLCWKR